MNVEWICNCRPVHVIAPPYIAILQRHARICPMYAWYNSPSNGILANEMFHNLPCNTNKMCLIRLLCPGASCASIWLWKLMRSHHDQCVCQQLTKALEAWKNLPQTKSMVTHTQQDCHNTTFWNPEFCGQLLRSHSSAVSPPKLVESVTKCEGVCAQPCMSLCGLWPFSFSLAGLKWDLGISSVAWQRAWLTESHDILLFDFALVFDC